MGVMGLSALAIQVSATHLCLCVCVWRGCMYTCVCVCMHARGDLSKRGLLAWLTPIIHQYQMPNNDSVFVLNYTVKSVADTYFCKSTSKPPQTSKSNTCKETKWSGNSIVASPSDQGSLTEFRLASACWEANTGKHLSYKLFSNKEKKKQGNIYPTNVF